MKKLWSREKETNSSNEQLRQRDLEVFDHVQKYGKLLLDTMGLDEAIRFEVAENRQTGEFGLSRQVFKRTDKDAFTLEWYPQTKGPREVSTIERRLDEVEGLHIVESYMTDYTFPYDNTIRIPSQMFLDMIKSVFGDLPQDAEIDSTIYSRSGR